MADYGVLGALAGAQQGLVTGLNLAAARRGEERQQRYLDLQTQAMQNQGREEASRLLLTQRQELADAEAQLRPLLERARDGETLPDEEHKLVQALIPKVQSLRQSVDDAPAFFQSQGWEMPVGSFAYQKPGATVGPRAGINLGAVRSTRSFMVNPRTGKGIR